MGIPLDLFDDLTSSTDFALWPKNKPIVDAFVAVQTQWRAFPLGASGKLFWQGLDYAGVRAGLKQDGITLSKFQWALFRIMEGEAASALNGIRG